MIHQAKKSFYTLNQGKIPNADYLENFNNLVDTESTFNVQLHDQYIVDIATEEKYLGGSDDILEPEKKEIV